MLRRTVQASISGARRAGPCQLQTTCARVAPNRKFLKTVVKRHYPRPTRAMSARPSVERSAIAPILSLTNVRACSGTTRRSFSQGSFADAAKAPDMFCFQCEQTRDGVGCQTIGVCGKTPSVAALQDLLVHACKVIAHHSRAARSAGKSSPDVDKFLLGALFVTVTNVNFDDAAIVDWLNKAQSIHQQAKLMCREAGVETKDATSLDFQGQSVDELVSLGEQQSLWHRRKGKDADYIGLQEMALYGLKGASAYMYHAEAVGKTSDSVHAAIAEVLDDLRKSDMAVPDLLALSMKVGATNYEVMELLDKGHTDTYGNPEPTPVKTVPKAGKCILVSGHDLTDLEEVLKQTEGKGVNVYTHGEMLPAHSYPKLKKFPHLAGNWGGPWQLQKFDFHEFPGAILMTSNCIIEPRKSYGQRIFTKNAVGWPGVKHVSNNDYSALITAAMEADGFDSDDVADLEASTKTKELMTGFGHAAVLSVAPTIIEAVKSGAISRFFLVGGCDGSEGERSYYTDLAKLAPSDTVFLTLGCGKYRINRLKMGDIGGIPRVLDMGQCNDSFSAIQVALALAKAFNTDVNKLPLNIVLSWFEQKAVAVLLTLLHLGIKGVRIGPKLPAFATPHMLNILVKEFGVTPIDQPSKDLKVMMKQ